MLSLYVLYFFLRWYRMSEIPPFGPGRAPIARYRDLTCDFAPPRAAIPLLVLRRARAPFRKLQGFLALAIALGAVLASRSGASLQMAAPNPVARSFGLAGPLDAGVVPVQARAPGPGPGRFQHRALAGAQGALKPVQCRGGTHRTNTRSIKSTSTCTWHAIHLYMCIYESI